MEAPRGPLAPRDDRHPECPEESPIFQRVGVSRPGFGIGLLRLRGGDDTQPPPVFKRGLLPLNESHWKSSALRAKSGTAAARVPTS